MYLLANNTAIKSNKIKILPKKYGMKVINFLPKLKFFSFWQSGHSHKCNSFNKILQQSAVVLIVEKTAHSSQAIFDIFTQLEDKKTYNYIKYKYFLLTFCFNIEEGGKISTTIQGFFYQNKFLFLNKRRQKNVCTPNNLDHLKRI